jgi:two-component system nitrogen regulation response regulator GlnG
MSDPHAPRILVVDDDAAVGWALEQVLRSSSYNVVLVADAAAALRSLKRQLCDLVITDIRMPGMSGLELLALIKTAHPELPVIVSTAHGTMETAIAAIGQGAFDYLPKPLDLERTLTVVRRALGDHPLAASAAPTTLDADETVLGSSPVMQQVYRRIAAAATTDLGVLLTGPSGSGKELVARSLHRHGPRKEGPFIAVTCGAVPEAMIERELFGSETPLSIGRIEAAHGGTLFLDEVGELPVAAQVSVLRFLEQQRFMRLGGEQPIGVSVRVIAATNRDLPKLIASGAFREDLAYHLKSVTIHLPPLAERLDDLAVLTRCFLARMARRLGRQVALTDEAMDLLHRYGWPGNVRELKHTIEEAAVLATGGVIGCEHLAIAPDPSTDPSPTALRVAVAALANRLLRSHPGEVHQRAIDTLEEMLFRAALGQTEGNQLRAAELLGINRITLKKRMDHFGIAKPAG